VVLAGIWMRKVQTEKTTRLGFLPYSLRAMDEDRMTRVFSARCNTKVGLRYMAINTGQLRTGPYNPKAVIPRAIHIEFADSEARRVTSILQHDYASGQHKFPMGIKMRFVPDVNQLMSIGYILTIWAEQKGAPQSLLGGPDKGNQHVA
jgi:hypothetical protein